MCLEKPDMPTPESTAHCICFNTSVWPITWANQGSLFDLGQTERYLTDTGPNAHWLLNLKKVFCLFLIKKRSHWISAVLWEQPDQFSKCGYIWLGCPFKFFINLENNRYHAVRRAHYGAVPPPFPNRKLSWTLYVLIHLKFITSRQHSSLSHLFIDYFLMIFRVI